MYQDCDADISEIRSLNANMIELSNDSASIQVQDNEYHNYNSVGITQNALI